MTTFDERERGFEAGFVRKQTAQFEVSAIQVNLFASWAADEMGLNGASKENYVKSIIQNGVSEGFANAQGAVIGDMMKANLPVRWNAVQQQWDAFGEQARLAVQGQDPLAARPAERRTFAPEGVRPA